MAKKISIAYSGALDNKTCLIPDIFHTGLNLFTCFNMYLLFWMTIGLQINQRCIIIQSRGDQGQIQSPFLQINVKAFLFCAYIFEYGKHQRQTRSNETNKAHKNNQNNGGDKKY